MVDSTLGCRLTASDNGGLPSISTGVYRYPLEDAARISVDTLHSTPTNVARCTLVTFVRPVAEARRRALATS